MHEDTDKDMEVNLEEKTAPEVEKTDKTMETEVEMEGLVSCSQCDYDSESGEELRKHI